MEPILRTAKQSDKQALKALWQNTFHESQSFLNWLFDVRFLPDYCAVAECDGHIVSVLHGLPAMVRIRDLALRCVLVGGVATLPEYRHQGLMRRCFSHFFADMRALSIPLAVHKPVDIHVYAPIGHYPVSDAQFVTLKGDAQRPDCGEQLPELSLFNDLSAQYRCYTRSAEHYGVSILRSYADFAFKFSDYASDGARCIGVTDDSGRLDGYCVYFEDDESLSGEECLACSQTGYQRLFAALARRAAGKELTLRLPPDVSPDFAHAEAEQKPHCVLGVIDSAALLLATGLSGGAVEITDSATPQNEGVFTLDGIRTNAAPELRISAGRLAQWVAGYRSMSELVACGEADAIVPDIAERLDQVGKRLCFTVDEY